MSKRCQYFIDDFKCKHIKSSIKYCSQHKKIIETTAKNIYDNGKIDIGICCMCKYECNPYSQVCGTCARQISAAI